MTIDPTQRLGLPPASDALSSVARILQGAAVVDKQLLRQLPARLPVQLFQILTSEKVLDAVLLTSDTDITPPAQAK